MAKMYPEFFPGEQNSDNPDYEVFETLRGLPPQHSVFIPKSSKVEIVLARNARLIS